MKKFMTLLLALLLVLSLGITFAACADEEDEPADSVSSDAVSNDSGTDGSETTGSSQTPGGNGGSGNGGSGNGGNGDASTSGTTDANGGSLGLETTDTFNGGAFIPIGN